MGAVLLLSPGCGREDENGQNRLMYGGSSSLDPHDGLLLVTGFSDGTGAKPEGPAAPASGGQARSGKDGGGTGASGETQGLEDKSLRDFHDDCLSDGCHAGLKKTRWVHGPVAVEACAFCHKAERPRKDHRFRWTRPKNELCAVCHRRRQPRDVAHEPYDEEDCFACHKAHSGMRNYLLAELKMQTLCERCHERHEPAHPHAPVEEGDCLTCHAAHESDHQHLLVASKDELCFDCHVASKKALAESENLHEPVAESCLQCHSAHGGAHPGLLREKPESLCLECHERVKEEFAGARSVHRLGPGEKHCAGCHNPHASDFDALLRVASKELCFKCHDREITLASGRAIPNIQQVVSSAAFLHEPLKSGGCVECHVPHASPHAALLRHPHPEATYVDFSESAYGMCFSCHDTRLAREEKTTATQFRDGDRNLHFVHVSREKGRACGVCHDPHGSKYPAHIREFFPFGPGRWKLPIRFEQTASGGTCIVGCHQQFRYDNTTPPAPAKEAASPK